MYDQTAFYNQCTALIWYDMLKSRECLYNKQRFQCNLGYLELFGLKWKEGGGSVDLSFKPI